MCEGVEDIDIVRLDEDGEHYAARYEQLKDFQSRNLSVGSKDGRSILANFASRYVEDMCDANEPRFRLVTTAERAEQKNADVDVISSWQARSPGDDPDEDFLIGIRDALEKAIGDFTGKSKASPERALRVQRALDWLDEEGDHLRWIAFLDAVEWSFQEDDLATAYAKLLGVVEKRGDVDPSLARPIVERLLVELITRVSLGEEENPRFDRERLDAIIRETEEEREAWASEHADVLALARPLLEMTLEQVQITQAQLESLSERVGKNNALLELLVQRGWLEAAPFGLKGASPVWDKLKLHTRATIATYPRVKINRHMPLPRATVQQLQEDLAAIGETRLFILQGEGGSGKSTALVTCAKHLFEDPDCVALLLNLEHIEAGTPVEALVPGAPNTTLDSLLLQALKETGRSRGVLIIDQLDRLSQVSASSEQKLEYFGQITQLIMRTIEHESLRVLVACRKFDSEADSRMDVLTQHEHSTTRDIGPLEEEDVKRVVEELGFTTPLTRAQLEVLAIPLHLHLLAALPTQQSDNARDLPIDEYNLYKRFWDTKRRALEKRLEAKWGQLHRKICRLFLTTKRRYVTELDIEDHLEDIEKLVSEDILRRTEDGFIYFHQRYEEYVFARYFDGDLLDYILGEDQSFLAVDQAKAILIARRQQRSHHERYAQDLRAIIFGSDVRSHYKWLVRGLLSTQTDLLDVEFDVWREMLTSDDSFIVNEALRALRANPGFIEAIERRSSFHEVFIEGICWGERIADEDAVFAMRSALLAHLLEQRPTQGARWVFQLIEEKTHTSLLKNVLTTDRYMQHRDVFDAFLHTIQVGLWDFSAKHHPGYIFQPPKAHMEWVSEVLTACVRYNLATLDFSNFAGRSRDEQQALREDVFASLVDIRVWPELTKRVPCSVIEEITPLLPELIAAFSLSPSESYLWGFVLRNADFYRHAVFRNMWFDSVKQCDDSHAGLKDEAFDILVHGQTKTAKMFRWHIASSSGGEGRLEQAVEELEMMLAGDQPLRLSDRYLTIVHLLESAFERLPKHRWDSLLEKIITYEPETHDPGFDGTYRDHQLYALLHALPYEALSEAATRLLADFQERLPASSTELTDSIGEVRRVDHTDDVELEAMSDEDVLEYILEAKPQPIDGLPMFETSKAETIRQATSKYPLRFAQILETHFLVLPAVIKDAIIWGWDGAMQRNSQAFDKETWDRLLNLAVRTFNDSPLESALRISYLLDKCSRVPGTEVVVMVADAMLTHPDPEEESWNNTHTLSNASVDCVRGRMAEILGRWICHSYPVFEQTREAIAAACQDPSTQVRAGVALPVLMSLNHDPDFALEQFLALIEGQPDELLATHHISGCFQYMTNRYPERLTPVIERMLASEVEDVRVAGGTAFGLSTFADASRLARVPALYADEAIARGIGEVWKCNLQQLSNEQCEALIVLFDHPAEDVLSKLTGLFRDTKVEWLLEHRYILDAYFDSRIARVRTAQVFFAFEDWKLSQNYPDIALEYIERTFELHQQLADSGESTTPIDTHGMCRMLDELYKQHKCERERVIELLDAMVKAGIWPAERTLREVQAYRD